MPCQMYFNTNYHENPTPSGFPSVAGCCCNNSLLVCYLFNNFKLCNVYV